MIVKHILQILGIAIFFFLIGYVLTYPYELSYNGSETVILLENSYEKSSIEELLNREEFKGKVLYIRIWEPFDTESRPYTDIELESFQRQVDSLKDNTDSYEYQQLSWKLNGRLGQGVPIEEQLDALESLTRKYKNSDVAFIYITRPDNDWQSKKDDLRKWKKAVKKYESPGYHMIMNPNVFKQIKQHLNTISNNGFLPFYFLANKQGNIIDYQAPWPQDTALLYPTINHLLTN